MKIPKWSALTRNQKIAGVLSLTLIGAAIYLHQLGTKVDYCEAKAQTVEKALTVEGKSSPKDAQRLTMGQEGILITDMPDLGAPLSKDQLICEVKPIDFTSRQQDFEVKMAALFIKGETSNDETVKNQTKSLKENHQKVLENYQQARVGYDSVLKLFKDGMVSEKAYKEGLTQLNSALNNYLDETNVLLQKMGTAYLTQTQLSEALVLLQADYEPIYGLKLLLDPKQEDGKTTEEAPKLGVQNLLIKSTMDGILSKQYGSKNQFLPLGAPVLEVAKHDKVIFDFDVPVDALKWLKEGDFVRVKDSEQKILEGTVFKVDNVLTDQLGKDGSIEKMAHAKALFADAEKVNLYQSQSVTVVLDKVKEGVTLPSEAVIEKENKYYVWYNHNGILSEKEIVVAFEADGLYVIKSGVKAGEKIVLNTPLKLGKKITFK